MLNTVPTKKPTKWRTIMHIEAQNIVQTNVGRSKNRMPTSRKQETTTATTTTKEKTKYEDTYKITSMYALERYTSTYIYILN